MRVRPFMFEGGGAGGGGSSPPADPPKPPADPPADPPTTPPPSTIPKDRFDEVNRQARDATKRAEDAEARLQEIADANKSEVEKANDKAAKAEKRADDAEAKLTRTLRNSALRNAAAAAGAIDADVIVAYANENGIEIDVDDPETATKAIGDIQEAKPTLFGEAAPAPRKFGTPSPGTPPPADDSDDPKMALGKGLAAAIGIGRSR